MDMRHIDNKIAAAVLRRQQEVTMENSTRIMSESLSSQGVPDKLIAKINEWYTVKRDGFVPLIDDIMQPLETGEVSFDDTVIALFEASIKFTADITPDLQQMMVDELQNMQEEDFE